MENSTGHFLKREFWIEENLNYVRPHYRLQKCARIVNRLAGTRRCDLLDVGCGPATLLKHLRDNIAYHGVDIAIHEPAPYLVQADFVENEIGFRGQRFDIVVAQGVFEYMGRLQARKFEEIARILKPGGQAVISYVNFGHINRIALPIYNNIQSIDEFRASLARVFKIERCFPTSHHWRHKDPGRRITQRIQMRMNWNIPFISSRLAVQYLFVVSLAGRSAPSP